jgi:RNA polymerase sigma-70 factor (sigma-E family)
VIGGEESAVVLAFATPTSHDKDAAVEALFREHFGTMVRLAFCLLGDRSAAEDVAQEAFVALHLHWGNLRDRGALLPYVRSVVFNQCRSRQRWLVRGRRALTDLGAPDSVPSSEDAAVLVDETHRLGRAIRDLPRRQREVIVCRFLLGLSEAETSAELDMSVGSVKQHTHRARAALQAVMGADR